MPVSAKPPFKLALAALFLDGPPRTAEEALALLMPLYGAEKFCRLDHVGSRLLTLKALGIVRIAEEAEQGGDHGASGPRWLLTRTGRERVLRAL